MTMTDATGTIQSLRHRSSIDRLFQLTGPASGALFALIVLSIYNVFATAHFLAWSTLRVNLIQVSTIVLVGIGMTFVIATGGIDLSVGSLMAIAGVLAPMIFLSDRRLLQDAWIAIPLAIVVPVLVAGAFGCFNGVLVTRFQIQPIIATLVLFLAGRGIAGALVHGKLREFNNSTIEFIGQGRVLGIPFQVYLMIMIVIAASW